MTGRRCAVCARTENLIERTGSGKPLCGDCAEELRVMVADARGEAEDGLFRRALGGVDD